MAKLIKNGRILKVLSIVSFVFIILALTIITRIPPASGYEISIYEKYPWYFWILIIAAIFSGQISLIIDAMFFDKNDNWSSGILPILAANVILLFMPFIRGYTVFGRYDELTHIGHIIDITNTSHISVSNFYPIDHILASIFYYVTNINVNYVITIISDIFCLFYIISIYILAKHLFIGRKETSFIFLFASILLISHESLTFAPYVQSFMLIPFILYVLFKSHNSRNSLEFKVLLILLLFLLVFSHPITTLFLILIFLILELCLFIKKNTDNKQHIEFSELWSRGYIGIILISFTTFFVWFFSFSSIVESTKTVLNWLLYKSGTTEMKTYSELLLRTNVNSLDLIELIINKYGQIIILVFISFFSSMYILNLWRKNSGETLKSEHIFFCIGNLVFIFVSILFFFNNFIIGYERVFSYIYFFSIIVTGLGFTLLFRSDLSYYKDRFKIILLVTSLILLLFFSTFNLYWSPIVKIENQQVAKAEIDGMNWFFIHRNEEMLIYDLGISQQRFYDLTHGRMIQGKNIRGEGTLPIDHFGYANKSSLSEYKKKPSYLLISIFGRIQYPEIYPEYEKYWKFTNKDFENLEIDNMILKIYTNGNLDQYLIGNS